MGILRLLIISIAVLVFCLLLLPRTKKEKIMERKVLKSLIAISIILIIIFSIALYQFRDSLLSSGNDNHPLATYLRQNPNLTELTLTKYQLTNIPIAAIQQLILSQKDLKTLILNNITPENVDALNRIYAPKNTIEHLVINGFKKYQLNALLKPALDLFELKSLAIHYPISEPDFKNVLFFLSNQESITQLDFEDAELTSIELQNLSQFLKTYETPLKLLNLTRNKITDGHISMLAKGIKQQNKLKFLSLKLNKLTTLHNDAIENLLQSKILQTLDLSFNRLEDNTVTRLLLKLTTHPTVSKIYLDRNLLTDRSLDNIETLLKDNPRIKVLTVKSELFSEKGLDKLNALAKQHPGVELQY